MGEQLYIYISAFPNAVSYVLVKENAGVQKPIYYMSKTLRGAEIRYTKVEKMIYVFLTASKKLWPYFQYHTIIVLTYQPLRFLLWRSDTSGCLARWAIELGEFNIEYKPRLFMKAQVLMDFVVECTFLDSEGEKRLDRTLEEVSISPSRILHVDGASNAQGCGANLIFASPDGVITKYALRFGSHTTNNVAEYEALIAGLNIAKEIGVTHIKILSDSQLVVVQVQKKYEAKNQPWSNTCRRLRSYLQAS